MSVALKGREIGKEGSREGDREGEREKGRRRKRKRAGTLAFGLEIHLRTQRLSLVTKDQHILSGFLANTEGGALKATLLIVMTRTDRESHT